MESDLSLLSSIRALVRRHLSAVRDLAILIPVMLVAGYICFEVDIFANENAATVHRKTIELDESLLLGGLLALGMLVFCIRRYLEQRRETALRIAAEQRARILALEDPLTALANRRRFDDALSSAVNALPRSGGCHALLMIDLNGFKQVNDIYGHAAGDAVLTAVAQRLVNVVDARHLVARLGGDEFAVLATHLAGSEAALSLANHILQRFERPFVFGSGTHAVGAGIGIALIPGNAQSADEAMRMADIALYRSKSERPSPARFFEESMDRHLQERTALETALREAIEADAIRPVFQPSVELRSQRVMSFEAMPHWEHPEFGVIAPERFIPIAEDLGLASRLFTQFIRHACEAANRWPPTISVAITIFPSELRDAQFSGRLLSVLDQTQFAPERLELQITESALVQDLRAVQSALGSLRAAGVSLTLDNFGTGYSSLYHLRSFKLDKVKIDRRYVDLMRQDEEGAQLVAALVGLGQGLGLTVAADGIDGTDQRVTLLGAGCQQGRGALFSAPMTECGVQDFLGSTEYSIAS